MHDLIPVAARRSRPATARLRTSVAGVLVAVTVSSAIPALAAPPSTVAAAPSPPVAAPAPPVPAAGLVTAAARNGRRSGLPWASGVLAHDARTVRAFAAMRRAPVDVLSVHVARGSWRDALHPWPLNLTAPLRKAAGVRIELTLPPFLPDKGIHANQSAQWRRLGRLLVARGEPDAIVNIGKEMTLPNPWACRPGNVRAWLTRWREAATALRSVPGQRFTLVWTVNEGRSQTGIRPERCYPGDRYVDVVGVDYYDQWHPIRTATQRDRRFGQPYGLDHWLRFATAHGKKIALPEWGVSSGWQWARHNGGDNPYYVTAVFWWLSRNRSRVAYESWFEEPAGYVASALLEPTRNDRARAAYVRQVARLRG